MEKLLELAEQIKDEKLREKVIEFLKNPIPTHKEIEDTKIPLKSSPASIKWHHKYEGGLIEHTVAVTKLALKMADVLEEVYRIKVDRDLIIAGGLLHDIMKPYNYTKEEDKFDHIENFHLDHLTLAVAELYKRDFPLEVIKVVASHHGDASPSKPNSIEAYLIHFADTFDAQLNDVAIRICQARSRDLGVDEEEIYKRITPLKVYEIRSKEGKKKLIEYLKELLDIEEEQTEKKNG
jgi:7,8-dihydroneopterin 2',3'-cyclic phosphate phosphodiesterase